MKSMALSKSKAFSAKRTGVPFARWEAIISSSFWLTLGHIIEVSFCISEGLLKTIEPVKFVIESFGNIT